MAGSAAFVGREGELSRLLGALGGGARLVLVVGDAGAGKTRFVTEAMARAAAAGMVMVRGECLPLAGTLPLLPVRDALGEVARLEGGGLLAAALDAAPGYVREEMGRLLPGMSPGGGTGPAGRDVEWSRPRLFAGVTELLAVVGGRSPSGMGLVVEDVHWADSETLDFLTFLVRGGRRGPVRVVATCRGDEAPLAEHVGGWLAQVRADAGTEEIRLGPLSRAEVAGQAAALAGGPVSPQVVDYLYARAEGNAFFTEQLVAAALAGQAEGGLQVPAGLPARLAELLAARAGRCAGDARAVLAGLAAARLLAEDAADGGAPAAARAAGRGGGRRAAARGADGAARAGGAGAVRGPGAGRGGGRALAGRGPPGRGAPGPGGGGGSRRAGVRLRAGGGPFAAGHRARPGPARGRCRGGDRRAAVVRASHRRVLPRRRQRARRLGRPGGLPPVRQPPRSSDRRDRLPSRRALPGQGCGGRRAAGDGGGAAAVRAGSTLLRARRRPARLRQRLPAAP